jgi:hypothetical protein
LPRILARLAPPSVAPVAGAVEPTQQNAPVVIYQERKIVAIARLDHGVWGLERVFAHETEETPAHERKADPAAHSQP